MGGEWTTRRRTITEADLAAYIGLSGDLNPLYADVEHARASHWGGVVVPAALVTAIVLGLGSIDVPVPATVGLVGMSWRYIAVVRPGDSIRSSWRLNRKRDVEDPRWGLAAWQVRVENQREELVAAGEVVRLVARRDLVAISAESSESRSARRRRRRRGGAGQAHPETEVAAAEVTASPPAAVNGADGEPRPLPAPEATQPTDTSAAVRESDGTEAASGQRRRRRGTRKQEPKPAGSSGAEDQARSQPAAPPQVEEPPLAPPAERAPEPPPVGAGGPGETAAQQAPAPAEAPVPEGGPPAERPPQPGLAQGPPEQQPRPAKRPSATPRRRRRPEPRPGSPPSDPAEGGAAGADLP